jgi:hypothetical protein
MPEWPGLGAEGLEDGRVEGRLGRPKSGLEGRLSSGRLMTGRFVPPGREGLLEEGREGRSGWLIPG